MKSKDKINRPRMNVHFFPPSIDPDYLHKDVGRREECNKCCEKDVECITVTLLNPTD
jgi:hypothetical protein